MYSRDYLGNLGFLLPILGIFNVLVLQAVFYFVFCHPNSPDSFEITTNFPKRVLKCKSESSQERVLTLEEAGLKNREVLFVNDLDA